MNALSRWWVRIFGVEAPKINYWRDVFIGPVGAKRAADLARRARLFSPTLSGDGRVAPDHLAYWEGRRAMALELLRLGEIDPQIEIEKDREHE